MSRFAVNILEDATFTIQGTAGGDNGNASRTPSGSSITFECDKVSIKQGRNASDHSTAQNANPMFRTKKLATEASIETVLNKQAGDAVFDLLQSAEGVVILFTATADGGNASGVGFVENVSWEYGSPSTLKFDLKPYGSAWDCSA